MLARLALLALGLLIAAGAHAAETVRVRAGAHDGFGRIAFDWPKPVEFSARIEGDRLVVSFARPFSADYAEVRRHLHAYLGAAAPGKDGRSVSFPLLRPVSAHAAVIEGVSVVDLRDGKKSGGKAAESVGVRTGEHDGFSRIVFDWRRDVPYKVEARDSSATVTFSRAASIDASALERDKPPFVEGFSTRMEAGRTVAEVRIAPGARVRHFRDGTHIALDVLAPAKQAARKPEPSAKTEPKVEAKPEAKPETKTELERRAQIAPEPTSAGPDPKAPRVALAQDGQAARLEFRWPQPIPAAAFVRAGHLWLVFGAPAQIDLRPLKAGAGPVLAAEQPPHGAATTVRLKLREGLTPSLRRDGGVWTVRLGPPTPPASAVAAVAEPAAAPGPRVLIAAAEPGGVVELADPEVGDRLIVVPTLAAGQGAPSRREFVEFALLPSAQGVALRPKVLGLHVSAVKDGVVVSAPGGLALSTPPARDTGSSRESIAVALDRPIMDLAAWSRPKKTSFTDERQALQRAVAQAPTAARNSARWELAKFLFANGFAPETLALLELIEEGDANAARDPAFRAVHGATLLLAGRPAEASAELAHGDLDRYADMALWRGAAFAADKRWDEANRQFGVAAGGFRAMPGSLRERLLLAWAKAAVEAKDLQSADIALGMAKELPKTPALEAQIALLDGHASELRREPDVALEQYALAEASSYRPVRGPAALARVELQLAREAIGPDEAIAELERLHFSWRGDEFEVTLMQRLAGLRFAKQDYAGGLDLLRQAVTYFPKSPLSEPLAQEMTRVFAELFQDGKADALSPVNALALYYEFKELTPAGAAGDAMIQKLADRLAGVDLLEQAARLLDHQVTYRLRGPEQARVGARLAVIQLLDKEPRQALASLEKTRAATLDPALEAERRQLAARAYADLGQGEEALRLLEGDASESAALLRADVHWRAQKWAQAAQALRELLATEDTDEGELGELEQAQVVKLAVALYMGNDSAGLDTLRRRYAARMAQGKHAESFSLLTAEIDPSKIEFRNLAGAIARVDELEAFMASYRTKLAQKSLSAIN